MPEPPLPPNQQLVRGERWPVVGERSPRTDASPWTVTVCGCVATERTFTLEELQALPQVTQKIDVHCVTRWSKLQMEFSGVPLVELIGAGELPSWTEPARYVSFGARSERNHSTSLSLEEVLELGPLVALLAEGKPLPTQHGGPVRMVMPGKYFYKSVKWLERIEFLAEDRLGYWEAKAGYHNEADPWQEQRYLVSNLSKQETAKLLSSRDFRGRDLRGISAAKRDLNDLCASGALLRDADFRDAILQRADFSHAKLSNAHLQSADLRGANFAEADLEGADLSGANLAGANFLGASLFGASFCEFNTDGAICNPAQFDEQTRIGDSALNALTDQQREFVRGVLGF